MEFPKSYCGFASNKDLSHDDRQERWAQQREDWGFDDTETWNLDTTLLRFLIPRLERLIEIRNQAFVLDEDHKDDMNEMLAGFKLAIDCDFPSEEEGNKIEKSFRLLAENYNRMWW